jgi:hypothetical protein
MNGMQRIRGANRTKAQPSTMDTNRYFNSGVICLSPGSPSSSPVVTPNNISSVPSKKKKHGKQLFKLTSHPFDKLFHYNSFRPATRDIKAQLPTLINVPFCSDNVMLARSSSNFASCQLSVLSEHHAENFFPVATQSNIPDYTERNIQRR